MTMKVTRLTTYWTLDEAATVIDFLDTLRVLYGKPTGSKSPRCIVRLMTIISETPASVNLSLMTIFLSNNQKP